MYIAKMSTRYPDFHGEGYYNFLMDESSDGVHWKVVDNSHDFSHQKTVFVDMTIDEILKKYPTKDKLNDKYFKEGK